MIPEIIVFLLGIAAIIFMRLRKSKKVTAEVAEGDPSPEKEGLSLLAIKLSSISTRTWWAGLRESQRSFLKLSILVAIGLCGYYLFGGRYFMQAVYAVLGLIILGFIVSPPKKGAWVLKLGVLALLIFAFLPGLRGGVMSKWNSWNSDSSSSSRTATVREAKVEVREFVASPGVWTEIPAPPGVPSTITCPEGGVLLTVVSYEYPQGVTPYDCGQTVSLPDGMHDVRFYAQSRDGAARKVLRTTTRS